MVIVLALISILMLITLSSAGRISENNRSLSCQMNLRSVHQGMMMYHADFDAYPAFGYPDPNTGGLGGLGLWALHTPDGISTLAGYLKNPKRFKCPDDDQREFSAQAGSGAFVITTGLSSLPAGFNSYQTRDDENDDNLPGATDEFNYLPYRGLSNAADPNYRRQLLPPSCVHDPGSRFRGQGGCPEFYAPRRVGTGIGCVAENPGGRFAGTNGCPAGARPRNLGLLMQKWQPREDTVVTWCPFHRRRTKPLGFDNVLFLDGSVQLVPSHLAGQSYNVVPFNTTTQTGCPSTDANAAGVLTPTPGNLWQRCPKKPET